MTEQRTCYFVMETNANDSGEFNALIAKENEPGYYKTDWYWGKNFKVAEEIADRKNQDLGITKKEACLIVLSSMRPML